jgi:hypothetical protein
MDADRATYSPRTNPSSHCLVMPLARPAEGVNDRGFLVAAPGARALPPGGKGSRRGTGASWKAAGVCGKLPGRVRGRGGLGRAETRVVEDLADRHLVGHERDQAHALAAAGAEERVRPVDLGDQPRPRRRATPSRLGCGAGLRLSNVVVCQASDPVARGRGSCGSGRGRPGCRRGRRASRARGGFGRGRRRCRGGRRGRGPCARARWWPRRRRGPAR